MAFVCPACVHRVTISRLCTCFGSKMAFFQIRDKNPAKFKIFYSCGHHVPKSARYDASINETMLYIEIIFMIEIVVIAQLSINVKMCTRLW